VQNRQKMANAICIVTINKSLLIVKYYQQISARTGLQHNKISMSGNVMQKYNERFSIRHMI